MRRPTRCPAPFLAPLLAAAATLSGCARTAPPAPEMPALPSAARVDRLYEGVRVAGLDSKTFQPTQYWDIVRPILAGSDAFTVERIGESAEGRPIRMVRFGTGPATVLMWSQMHGDEPTASMALADIFALIARRPDDPLVRAILGGATVYVVPVLNPDGAARFQRRNAQGIDVNRDARALATSEARALKAARDRVEPDFAFNLHDQWAGTRVGDSDRGVAIALLSPAFDETRDINDVRRRAIQVAGVIRAAIEPLVGDHIARYDDTFNPRAFGDLMTQWGASTVLVESGGWKDDPEKQYLRRVNFVGLLAALDAIATGSYAETPLSAYELLPENGRHVADLLVRGGTLAIPGLPPARADLLVQYDDALRRSGGVIVDVGDLADAEARDTLDAAGLYVVPGDDALDNSRGQALRQDAPADFVVSRDAEGRNVVARP